MKSKLLLITLLGLFVALGNSFAQSYKVIVNSSNATASLSKKEVSDLFLKKKTKWTSGTAVMPVDLSSSSSVRESFSQQVHGKSTSAIRSFWQQAAFSGAGTAPAEKSSDDEVIEYVKRNAGAVGYVSATANTGSVHVVTIK